jgi:hypothetical protein
MRSSAVGALLVLSSCTFPSVVPEARNTEFRPKGEVIADSRTVSFDEVRVRSPHCIAALPACCICIAASSSAGTSSRKETKGRHSRPAHFVLRQLPNMGSEPPPPPGSRH